MSKRRLLTVALVLGTMLGLISCHAENGESAANAYEWSVSGFSTDFSKIRVDPAQILSGGPPKDGIPSIDDPSHESIADAAKTLSPDEPVIVVEADGESVIYPIRILTWHEIVNDQVGSTPLAITFCPLCNTGIVFQRTHDGQILDFGTTGRLLGSNLLMYDRQTETWWQQASGEGLIGEYSGDELTMHPSRSLSFAEAAEARPEALVLSDKTGFSRPYGRNPYPGYDTSAGRPFLFQGPIDEERPAMERSIVVMAGGKERVVPYGDVREEGVLHIDLGREKVVLFYSPKTASALDAPIISEGRNVGSVNAYKAEVGGRAAEFDSVGPGLFRDSVSGSEWNSAGIAVSGTEEGNSLDPVVGVQHFWFSARFFTE